MGIRALDLGDEFKLLVSRDPARALLCAAIPLSENLGSTCVPTFHYSTTYTYVFPLLLLCHFLDIIRDYDGITRKMADCSLAKEG